MVRSTPLLAGLVFVSLSACGGAGSGINARVASTVAVTKDEPAIGCEYVGSIMGITAFGELRDAHADVIRNALLAGGNHVTVDIVERPLIIGLGGYTIRGRLFACPGKASPAEMARLDRGVTGATGAPDTMGAGANSARAAKSGDEMALPKAPCEPECNTGFICAQGTCVLGCNPPCAQGEQCGADRTCHGVR